MKTGNYFLILIILISCSTSTTKNKINITGKYATKGKNINHNIDIISIDSTFTYSIGYSGSLISECSGIWKLNEKKDSIELFCEDGEQFESLTSTYMKKRKNKFKIYNKKLINGKVILYKR